MKITLLCAAMTLFAGSAVALQATSQSNTDGKGINYESMPDILPGTKPLSWNRNLSDTMMEGAHRFIDEKIQESVRHRPNLWNRNYSSREAYERSVEPNRERLKRYIGLPDNSVARYHYNTGLEVNPPPVSMQKLSAHDDPPVVAETESYRIYQVRWPVLNGVDGEGLLLEPNSNSRAGIVALPDADQSPEQLAGLAPGIPAESQFARRLAENGYRVVIPVLIDRSPVLPGEREEQTQREWIYRQAFHMGRHLIGYEVQKVLSAVDWLKQSAGEKAKVGVAGYGEGGLIAFYASAVDNRIDATLVSGYFDSRQQVWDEPIYRNVWGLLTEFGDAEIASLIAPRPLVIEYSSLSDNVVQSTARPSDYDQPVYSGYKGRLQTPSLETVKSEFDRIDEIVTKTGFQARYLITGPKQQPVSFGSGEALDKFAQSLGYAPLNPLSDEVPADGRRSFDPQKRQMRQVRQLNDRVQWLLRVSDMERNKFFLHEIMPEFEDRSWSTKSWHPYHSPDRFVEQAKEYRHYFWEEILGKFEDPMLPPNPRTRKIYDETRWTGYETVLDVYDHFIAAGILLVPKDLKQGEKRPVVVVQHGRNGMAQRVIEGNYTAYNNAGAKLADQGFIVYAPHGLFRGEDRYRWLDRKANTLKKTLFSFIVSQHDQTLRWLGTLPFVDRNRIAFYGLSYGGETAMRVPAVLEGYSLSICSADFGDWTRKVVDTTFEYGFMDTIEWEMPYFNMGSTFSYAEMAYLIFPRPFMVERGHDDLVQPDEWVAYEYGKVNYLYDKFGLEDKTRIEYFNGGHSMRLDGSVEFLHKHLDWP